MPELSVYGTRSTPLQKSVGLILTSVLFVSIQASFHIFLTSNVLIMILVSISSLSSQIPLLERQLKASSHLVSQVCSFIEQCHSVEHANQISISSVGIECVTLTEPGAVTVVCASRVRYYVGDPSCFLIIKTSLNLTVSCKTL